MPSRRRTARAAPRAWRIAVVTRFDRLIAQQCLAGIYQRASLTPAVKVEIFDALAADFERSVLPQLRVWRPSGLIIRTREAAQAKLLRRAFPGLPIVATAALPRRFVDACVAGRLADFIAVARHHFRKGGLDHVALFSVAADHVMAGVRRVFREMVPDGWEVICPQGVFHDTTPAGRRRRDRLVAEGLRGLPLPVGIMAAETETAEFLLQACRKLGLEVPEQVQLIGPDQEDRCLACDPPLSSIELPNRKIGQVAFETLLGLLRQEPPAPPPEIQVSGSRFIPRGTTRKLAVGATAATAAIDLMRALATKGLTAADVVKRVSVGRATLYRTFAAATGTTPARHLRRLRLQEACRLLRETDETMTAIAEMCGFASPRSFMNFFRRELATTPTAYRQGYRAAREPTSKGGRRRPS